MTRVAIVTALAAEARALDSSVRQGTEPSTLEDGSLLLVSGVGLACAARASQRLIEAGAAALVSFGLAGGLDPALPAGAICLPVEVLSPEGARMATCRSWRERLAKALAGEQSVCAGNLLSSARAIDSAAAKASAHATTGAVAVDMESAAIAQAAAAAGLPFLVVRVIVDTAEDTLPSSVVRASRGGSIRVGALIGALLRAPADLPGVIRLASRFRTANRALRRAAACPTLREAFR